MILFPYPRVVSHVRSVLDNQASYGDHDDRGGGDHSYIDQDSFDFVLVFDSSSHIF